MQRKDDEVGKMVESSDYVSTGYPKDIAGFSFGSALNYMREGRKVARQGWNGKGMFLFLVPNSFFEVTTAPLLGMYPKGTILNYQAHINMKTADNTLVPWLASQSDILAYDWMLVP